MLYFFESKFFSVNIIVTVETTVDTVILAVIRYIERSENIDGVSEMILCKQLRLLVGIGELLHINNLWFPNRSCDKDQVDSYLLK